MRPTTAAGANPRAPATASRVAHRREPVSSPRRRGPDIRGGNSLSSVQRDLARRDVWSMSHRALARAPAPRAAPRPGWPPARCCRAVARDLTDHDLWRRSRWLSRTRAARRRTTDVELPLPSTRGLSVAALLAVSGSAVAAVGRRPGAGRTSPEAGPSRVRAGGGVATLQRALGISADGVFGPQTERALKRWQRSHGLVADGIAGPATRRALGIAQRAGAQARAAAADALEPRRARPPRSRGGGVSALQRSARRARRRRVRLADRAGAEALAAPARAERRRRGGPRHAPRPGPGLRPDAASAEAARAGAATRLVHRAPSHGGREPDRLQALQVRRRARLVPRLGLRLLRLGVLRASRRRPAGPPARLGRVHAATGAPGAAGTSRSTPTPATCTWSSTAAASTPARAASADRAGPRASAARRATWPATPRASSATVRDHRAVPGTDGRFAPSPSGPLHLGNLRTALLAWLFARSQGARFLLRIEDLDPQRSRPEHERGQIADLRAIGIDWDGEPVRQSELHRALPGGARPSCDAARARLSVLVLARRDPRRSRGSARAAARGRLPGHLPRAHRLHSAPSASAWRHGRPR